VPAADLVAGDERLLRGVGVEAEAHLDVGEVDPRVADIDGDVLVANLGGGSLADREAVGGTVFLDGDFAAGLHGGGLRMVV
jgi:hypothetical protein